MQSTVTAGALATGGLAAPHAKAEGKPLARHLVAEVTAPHVPFPADRRLPFGWRAAAIGAAPVSLRWPDLPLDAVPTRLRLTVALDVRDEKRIEAVLPQTGRVLGAFEVRFASLFQVYEIALAPGDAADLRREGVNLRLKKGAELHVFTGGDGIPSALLPHLLLPGDADALTEFFARLGSLASVQAFSWMEGCVLDGLLDLASLPAHAALREVAGQHLALFFQNGQLVYENQVSAPSDGRIYGIEGTLPFAALAKLQPQNPMIEIALKFWQSRKDAQSAIIDGKHTSSEGAYTVGYPLAVIGKARRDETLEQLALTQLRVRQARLFQGTTFWRTSDEGGGKGNRNWARGIAWQLLGMVRTLRELKHRPDTADLIEQFRQLAAWAQPFQRADGLWSVFVDEPQLAPDTAGSAGIAAALAIGVREGWLDAQARRAAENARDGLKNYLTPDGFLGGVAQSNKGGEALQRGDYRVIFQMAMGLTAQLIAALEEKSKP